MKPARLADIPCSNPIERGISAVHVAARTRFLSAADAALLWFIQKLSHAPGGFAKLAAELVAQFPERLATPTMQKLGFKPGQIYNAEQVRAVRGDFRNGSKQFPLKGETPDDFLSIISERDIARNALRRASLKDDEEAREQERRQSEKYPSRYPAADFVAACVEEASGLKLWLLDLCVRGESDTLCAPWYFPTLIESLREYQTAWIEQRSHGVTTEIGRQINETLDYAVETRCMVLIDGLARTGKTFAAKAWCQTHPGQARYVQVPSSNDELGFYQEIAKGLHIRFEENTKARELRARIETVLQTGQLCLVLDEAHYLWPQTTYRDAMPARIAWLMTALVNHGAPVALITTPQFIRSQKALERRSHWTSEQFTGRLGHYQKLPDSLAASDLTAVAQSILLDADVDSIELLVTYAQASTKYLAAIETAARRAQYNAAKAKRRKVTFADVRAAITGAAIPSDAALSAAVAAAQQRKPGRPRTIAAALKAPLNPVSTPAKGRANLPAIPDLGADRTHSEMAA